MLTPAQAIVDLRNDVATLPHPALRQALRVQLNVALAALAQRKPTLACQSMRNFSLLVQVARGRWITRPRADYLLAQSRDIRALMGCR